MQLKFTYIIAVLSFFVLAHSAPVVQLGIDRFFSEDVHQRRLKDKNVGLITNHTGIDSHFRKTIDLFKEGDKTFKLKALFAPEHGLLGESRASEIVSDRKEKSGIPIYSLFGQTRRPTEEMLKGIDVLIYDIQDIGCRSYTYATTLFYIMEEAAKKNIQVIVLDRPNPINGLIVDGPMVQPAWRSFVSYLNVPYCHGMTIGELASFFNEEYQVGCNLQVIAMKGWKRGMGFKETGLAWIPTSPFVSEADTPLFCATTGILGELNLVSLGGGYQLPFKLIGAPWIQAEPFAKALNAQKFPGVTFLPFYYRPYFGMHKDIESQGVIIIVTDKEVYRPVAVQYLILGILKSLYPEKIADHLTSLEDSRKKMFCLVNGNGEFIKWLQEEKFIIWKCIAFQKEEREAFLQKRKKYLLYEN